MRHWRSSSLPLSAAATFIALALVSACGDDPPDPAQSTPTETAPAASADPIQDQGTESEPTVEEAETVVEETETADEPWAPSPQRVAWLAGLDRGLHDMTNPQQGVSLSEARQHYEIVCSSCHGERGAGDGRISADLDPPAADLTDPLRWDPLTDGQRYSAIQDGIADTTMGPFGAAMSAEQIWNLVTLINGFVDDSRRPPPPADPEQDPS